MTEDERLRAAFQELAPEVSTEGVMEALDARLAAAHQEPAPVVHELRARAVRVLAVAAAIAVIALIGSSFAHDGGSGPQDQAAIVSTSDVRTSSTGRSTDEPGSSLPSTPGSTTGPGRGPGSGQPGSAPADGPGSSSGLGTSTSQPERGFGGADPPFTTPSTTDPSVSTSTGPTGPQGTTTTGKYPPETTTTLPPDTVAPVLDPPHISDTTVWESGAAACADRPHVITIQTKATDDVGVLSVHARGPIVGGSPRGAFFTQTGPTSWELVLGPWPVGTVAPGKSARMDLELSANDGTNTSDIQRVSLTVKSATTC